MTREDAKYKFQYFISMTKDENLKLMEIIDKIYNSFENRICKNCIHYDKDDKVCVLLDIGVLDNTFGCKVFKPKGE